MNLLTLKKTLVSQGISLSHVVAYDNKRCIGKDNRLAWHIPEDLKHFKTITTGGVVVMGRKTFESMGKPLPNRINWVITKDVHWTAEGVKVAHSLEQALSFASDDVLACDKKTLFVIGGGEIFAQTLPIMDKLYITCVDLDVGGDTFYPALTDDFCLMDSQVKVSQSGIKLVFETYQNKS